MASKAPNLSLSLIPYKTYTWLYFLKEPHLSYIIILAFKFTLLYPLSSWNKGYLETWWAAKASAAILLYIQNPIVLYGIIQVYRRLDFNKRKNFTQKN